MPCTERRAWLPKSSFVWWFWASRCCLVYFGYLNFLRGFSSFRMPSMTPIASLYVAIPISGALIALFTIEQLVNGCRKGFDHPEPIEVPLPITLVEP